MLIARRQALVALVVTGVVACSGGSDPAVSAPVALSGSHADWKVVAAAYGHSFAVDTDGTLWAWGYNFVGQLGNGTTTDRRSPVSIGSGFASVAASDYHTVAVKTDGTLWAWGYNSMGQLGTGTTTDEHSPMLIGGGFVSQSVAAGSYHTLAVKTDGTLWAWGANWNGQIGDGTGTNRWSPVQIGEGFASVAAGYAFTMRSQ